MAARKTNRTLQTDISDLNSKINLLGAAFIQFQQGLSQLCELMSQNVVALGKINDRLSKVEDITLPDVSPAMG